MRIPSQDIDCIGNDLVVDRGIREKQEAEARDRARREEIEARVRAQEEAERRAKYLVHDPYQKVYPQAYCAAYPVHEPRPATAREEPKNNHPDNKIEDALDLSTILNILDGTLESPGRIVIMTSNHPERLDRALVRKGRIDLSIEFTRASEEIVENMFEAFFEQPWPATAGTPKGGARTPAEVSAVLFENFDTPSEAAAELAWR